MKRKMISAVILFMTAFAANATTYKYIGDTTRGAAAVAANWTDDSDNPAPYAPTSSSATGLDYVVKGTTMASPSAGGGCNYYGHITFGEVGGDTGSLNIEPQKFVIINFASATFAKGDMWDGGGNWAAGLDGIVSGNIEVTAPATAPFTFTTRFGSAEWPRRMEYRAVFTGDENCGYKWNGTLNYALTWTGSLAGYLGTLDFSRNNLISVTFGADTGTIDLKELKFAAGNTLTVDNLNGVRAATFTSGTGTTVNLAATISGGTVETAGIRCSTANITGTININLAEFTDPPARGSDQTLEIVLFEAENGGLTDSMFNVDLGANADRATYQGCAVNAGGTKLIATFVIPGNGDTAYYSLASVGRDEAGNTNLWANLDGEHPDYGLLSSDSAGEKFVLSEGNNLIIHYNYSWTYYPQIVVGTAEDKSILYYGSQYNGMGHTFQDLVFRNGTLKLEGLAFADRLPYLAGKVTVETPAADPLIVQGHYGTHDPERTDHQVYRLDFRASLFGASSTGIKWQDSTYVELNFNGDLSGYLGSLDFSYNANCDLLFGANSGTLDFSALKLAAGGKVAVSNAEGLTVDALEVGDGATFEFARKGIKAGTLVKSSPSDVINVKLGLIAIPIESANTEIAITLFELENGTLSDTDLNVTFADGQEYLQSCGVEEGNKYVARFLRSVDSTYYYVGSGARGDGALADKWENYNGENPDYAPQSDQCTGQYFGVKDGKALWPNTSNTATHYYPRITIGEIGGTEGRIVCESQRGNLFQVDDLMLANGEFVIRGMGGATCYCRMGGFVTVTAPAYAPIRLYGSTDSTESNLRVVSNEMVYAGASTVGMRLNNAPWEIRNYIGDWSEYHGSLDLSYSARLSVVWGPDTGTFDFNALVFAAGQSIKVQNVNAPLKANTMTIGDGAVFTLSGMSPYEDYYQNAMLEANTFVLGGNVNLVLDLGAVPASVSSIPLLRTSGAIDTSKLNVQAQGEGAGSFRGITSSTVEGITTVYATLGRPGSVFIFQ